MIQSIKNSLPKITMLIRAFFVVMWLGTLAGTDALFSVYALCAVVCMYCMFDNVSNNRKRPEHGMLSISLVCAIFSLLVFMANYTQFTVVWYMDSLYYPTNILKNGLNAVNCLIGGFCVAYEIVVYALTQYPKQISDPQSRIHSGRMFWLVFASVLVVDLVYLFFDEYPGHITPDALYQIIQGYTNSYMNDHPFWNTLYIKGILNIGYFLFGSPNGAMALYSVLQILMMAGCFAYALMTLYQSGVPKWLLAIIGVLYVLIPYNIVYSISMYKDVPFSLSVLLVIVAMYRMMRGMSGKRIWDQIVCILGVLGVCFSRTNGFALSVLVFLFCLPYLLKYSKKFLFVLLVLLVIVGILTGPVIYALGVAHPETSEAFSLPLQQLARVVCEGCPLTPSQEALLARIFDMENLPEIYQEWCADPIKWQVRENDNAYFSTHLTEYLKLWLELGLKYPVEYFEAWVEQTKGYWNGGYSYFQYVEMMQENTFGFAKTSGNNIIAKLFDLYFAVTRQAMLFEPINSIGLQVWIAALCCYLNLRRKRPEYLLSLPLLLIIAGLLIGTPVYAEFRYAYPIFMACPFVAAVSIYQTKE